MDPMLERIYGFIGGILWRAVLWTLILTAIAVSLLTAVLPLLPSVNTSLTAEIQSRTGFEAEILEIAGEMEGFRPRLTLVGVSITDGEDEQEVVFQAERLQVTLNPWRSLLQRQLIFSEVRASDVFIPARLDNTASGILVPIDPSVFATEIERLALNNMRVSLLREYSEAEAALDLVVEVDLRRSGSTREIQLRARGDGGLSLSMTGIGIGNPLDLSQFSGELNGRLVAEDVGAVSAFLGLGVEGSSDLFFWTEAKGGEAQTTFQASGEVLPSTAKPGSNPAAFSLEGLVTSSRQTHWLNVVESAIELNATQLEFSGLHLGVRNNEWEVVVNDVDLATTAALVIDSGLVPEKFVSPLENAELTGRVGALSVIGSFDKASDFRVSANFENIQARAHGAIPGVQGLTGTLALNGGIGRVEIDSDDFSLAIPTQFTSPLQLGRVTGLAGFVFTSNALRITSGRVVADADDFKASALITGHVPIASATGEGARLNVVLGSDAASTQRVLEFTPKTIDSDAYQWMQSSLGTGEARRFGFVLRGGIRKRDAPLRSIQISAEADLDAVIMRPELPLAERVLGHVSIDNALVTFDIDSATVGSLAVSSGLVQVGKVLETRLLTAHATIEGDLPKAVNHVAALPYLPVRVSQVLSDLTTSGGVMGHLALSVPIKGARRIPDVSTRVLIRDGSLDFAGLPIELNKLAGGFVYEYPTGITEGAIDGFFLGRPLTLDLDLANSSLGLNQSNLSVKTQVLLGRPEITHLLGRSIPGELLVGETEVDIAFQAGDGVAVQITSDLGGLAVGLPEPFAKAAQDPSSMNIDLAISESLSATINYADVMAAKVSRDAAQAWRAAVSIGSENEPRLTPNSAEGTVNVSGQLAEIDALAWSQLAGTLSGSADFVGPSVIWRDVSTDALRFGDTALGAFRSSGRYQAKNTSFQVASDYLSANIDFDAREPLLNVQFDRLNLSALPQIDAGRIMSGESEVAAGAWPMTTVSVASLILSEKDLGSLSFGAQSSEQEVRLFGFEGMVDGVNFEPGTEIIWDRSTASTRTSIDLTLADATNALTLLDAKSVVDFSAGTIKGELGWDGAPINWAPSKLSGNVELQLSSGSFLPIPSQATDPLRFIGVFNLAGLVQRANVNQLFDPGLTFDRARGDFSLNKGKVGVNEFSIRNGGGSLTLGGDFSMQTEEIDAELVVTLPLVDNIPWVAALAGGLPIAAGAYLASKVFEDQMTRLSSGVYSVSGPIASPAVKFMRVFDASLSTSKSKKTSDDQSVEGSSESERR